LFKQYLRRYRKSINPPYSGKDVVSILGTLIILVSIPLTAFLVGQVRQWGSKAAGPVDYMDMDVAVVYYGINSADLAKLQNGLKIAREFYWRNSGLKLNLNLIYIPINQIVYPESNSVGDSTIRKAITDAGYQISDFGGIFHISSDVDGTWSYGVHGNFDVGFSHSPCNTSWSPCWVPTSVVYPGNDLGVNYGIVWIFTHEFEHALDAMYAKSGYPEMFHGDQPEVYAVRGGEQFSYQAEGLRRFNNWLGLINYTNKWGTKWGAVEQFLDNNGNGIPDNDSSLPIDDARLGVGWDKEKYMAGIYQGSLTGDLYGLPAYTNKFSPVIDGNIEAGWTFITSKEMYDELGISSEIYAARDDSNIYLAGTASQAKRLHLWLDKDGDGWWNGKNNLEISYDISTDNVTIAHASDFSDEVREYRCSLPNAHMKDDGLCDGMWDDESGYPYGRIIAPADIVKARKLSGGVYSFEIKIPTTALTETQEIGYRLVFEGGGRATVFEDYQLIYISGSPPDREAPTVSVSSPSNGATVSGTAVTVLATASDNVGVTKVEFYVDTSTKIGEDTTSPYSTPWNTTTVSNGSHSLLTKAYDAANNVGLSPLVSVTVDNPTGKIGDINGDGKVDIFDLSILLTRWGSNDATADLNKNGVVDIFDLSILLSHWGG